MNNRTGRLNQIILIGTFIGFSWLGMQAVHELGHVLGAILTGGRVTTVVLHPLTISRTDVFPNPHPLIEVWAGAIAFSGTNRPLKPGSNRPGRENGDVLGNRLLNNMLQRENGDVLGNSLLNNMLQCNSRTSLSISLRLSRPQTEPDCV